MHSTMTNSIHHSNLGSKHLSYAALTAWGLYLIVLFSALPIPEEYTTAWIFGVTFGVIGILAASFTLRGSTVGRRILELVAIGFIIFWVARITGFVGTEVTFWKKPILEGVLTVLGNTKQIIWQFILQGQYWGALQYVYAEIALPLIQIVIMVMSWRLRRRS